MKKCENCGVDVIGKGKTCSEKCRKALSRAKKLEKKSVTTVTESVTQKPAPVTPVTSVTSVTEVINDPEKIIAKAKKVRKADVGVPGMKLNEKYASKIYWGGQTKNGVIHYELPDGTIEKFRIR